MTDWVMRGMALLVGASLGVFFFGGLWWTVRSSLVSKQPAIWLGLSGLVRVGVVLAGFYWVAGHDATRWLAAVLGFMFVQRVSIRWLRPTSEYAGGK
uniref:N-ATPase, AtpR subunit n=1 Tax=mine drainage metagenome TaxID=410659 RepID=E6QTJ0_9ZZZZ